MFGHQRSGASKSAAEKKYFGTLNYVVLFTYLGLMVAWWAAGCSIFATMLSSLTFTGVPAKAYAQDWVYAVGDFMIPVVAFLAVYVALPFYRQIDATRAYEYLEQRFNRPVRLFGSASFTIFHIFHIFRMAIVMSLTGLALALATPLTPTQSVLLMGLLSIIYCALGGIEAVIRTDTIQTFVLLGGLFVLGVAMFYLWKYTAVTGYIYTTVGIATCFVVGYLASLLTGDNSKNLTGLTIHTAATAD